MNTLAKIASFLKRNQAMCIFIVLSLCVGTFFVFSVPIGYNEDEGVHIFRAYSLSRGNLTPIMLSSKTTNTKVTYNIYGTPAAVNLINAEDAGTVGRQTAYCGIGENILPGITSTDRSFNNAGCSKPSDATTQASHDANSTKLEPSSTEQVATIGASGYIFVAYIPGAIGFFIAQIINPSVATAIYMARFSTLLAYVAIIAFAIYLIRDLRSKWLVMATGLLPGALVLGTAVNVDSILIPVTLLFFALLVRVFHDNSSNNRLYIFLLLVTAILMPLLKAPYAIISLGVLFLPIYPSGRKGIYWRLAMAAAILLPTLLWSYATNDMNVATNYMLFDPLGKLGSTMNLSKIIANPIGYLVLYFKSLFSADWFSGVFTLTHQRVRLPSVLVVTGYTSLVVAAITAAADFQAKVVKKSWLIMALFTAGLLGAFVLPTLTYARQNFVEAIISSQGRYFIPFLPFILLFLAVLSVKKFSANKFGRPLFIGLIGATLLISCVWYYYAVHVWAM